MSEIDDLLNEDDIKDILDKTIADIDNIESIIICYQTKDDTIKWKRKCRRSEGLGMLDIMHDCILKEET